LLVPRNTPATPHREFAVVDAVPEFLGSVLQLDEVLAGVGEQGKEVAWRSGSCMSLLDGLDGGGDPGIEVGLGCGPGGYLSLIPV